MACPPVEVTPGVFISKAEQYCDVGCVNIWATDQSNTPVGSWLISVGLSSDWSAAAADPQITFLFVFPAGVNTLAEMKAYLRATTVGDLTAGRRSALQTRLDNLGVPRTDFTLATPLSKVFRRVVGFLKESDYRWAFDYSIGGDG